RQGGSVRLIGSGLSGVTKVTFLGARGKSDDVSVNVRSAGDRSITLKIPLNAKSGRLALTAPGTVTTSATTSSVAILPAPPPPPSTGQLTPVPGPPDPGAGQLEPDGRYAWRLTATGASGAKARSAQVQDTTRDAFDLHDHIFPVRARHTFGDAFGVQRQGHTHQGQDVLAACGSKLAGVEAGTVLYRRFQSAAGYYLILHGDETGTDYGYMHMRAPSPFAPGDHLTTGEI